MKDITFSERRSLCFECDRAFTNQCCWASDAVPVKGWIADYRAVKVYTPKTEDGEAMESKLVDSYLVHDCPEYVPYKRIAKIPKDDIDTEGVIALMKQYLKLARKDFILKKGNRTEVEHFFKELAPDKSGAIITKLEQMAAKHDRQSGDGDDDS